MKLDTNKRGYELCFKEDEFLKKEIEKLKKEWMDASTTNKNIWRNEHIQNRIDMLNHSFLAETAGVIFGYVYELKGMNEAIKSMMDLQQHFQSFIVEKYSETVDEFGESKPKNENC